MLRMKVQDVLHACLMIKIRKKDAAACTELCHGSETEAFL